MIRDSKGRFVKKAETLALTEALNVLRAFSKQPDLPDVPHWVQEAGARKALAILERACV